MCHLMYVRIIQEFKNKRDQDSQIGFSKIQQTIQAAKSVFVYI